MSDEPMSDEPVSDEPVTDEALVGGCQCGAVRYRVTAAAREIYHCHCSICRKLHGALYATWAVVPRGQIEVTRGEDALAAFESSPGVRRRFCRSCGCQLLCEIDSDRVFDWFAPATLDGGAHPGHDGGHEQHIFVGSKVAWLALCDDLKRFEAYPPAYSGGGA